MTTALTGTKRKDTYGDVLQLGNSGVGAGSSAKTVRDGNGVATTLSLSTTQVLNNGIDMRPRTGWTTANQASSDSRVNALAVQSDGKIVCVGDIWGAMGSRVSAAMRFNADGSVDTAFGTNGLVTWNAVGSAGQDEPLAVAIQSDGKIVVAGYVIDVATFKPVVVRLTAAGVLDSTFGTGGITVLNPGSVPSFYGVVVLSTGRIVAAGSIGSNMYLVGFTTAGVVDTGFATAGTFSSTLGAASAGARCIAVDSNGKLVVGGKRGSDCVVARFDSDGNLDTAGFGSPNGYAVTVIPGTASISSFYALAFQSDGKIVAAGTGAITGSDQEFVVARYSTAGVIDSSFGSSGIVTTHTATPAQDNLRGVGIDSIGCIVAAGWHQSGAAAELSLAVASYRPAGTLDDTFGNAGLVYRCFDPKSRGQAMAVLSDRSIVVGGYSNPTGASRWFLAKFHPDGSFDRGFGDVA